MQNNVEQSSVIDVINSQSALVSVVPNTVIVIFPYGSGQLEVRLRLIFIMPPPT